MSATRAASRVDGIMGVLPIITHRIGKRINRLEQLITLLLSISGLGMALLVLRKYRIAAIDGYFSIWLLVGLLSGMLLLMQTITYYADWNNPVFNLLSLLFYVFLIAVPPMVYMHLLQVIKPDPAVFFLNSYHLLPAAVLLIVNVFGFLVITFGTPASVFHTYVEEIVFFVNFTIITFFFILQNIFYVSQCYRLWRATTTTDNVPLSAPNWTKVYIGAYVVFIAAAYIQQIVYKGYTGWTLTSIFGIYGLFLIRHHRRRPAEAFAFIHHASQFIERKKSDDEPLIDEDMAGKLHERLMQVIRDDKIYLQPDLSLSALSKAVDTNDKYLRYVLSRTHASGFVSFVNHYRIEDAKTMLSDEAYSIYTVESIGQMAGFKSKSSFYSAFKDETGMTPFQYRQEQASN